MNKWIRGMVKKGMSRVILPRSYKREAKKRNVDGRKALFVSAHGGRLSANLLIMRREMQKAGFKTKTFDREVDSMTPPELWRYLKRFTGEYASCGILFLDSYFLPVSACRKRPETKVIQLWHSGGLLKKMGYDTGEDLAGFPRGFTRNYDLVTVSAPCLTGVWEHALGLESGKAEALGLPRTDRYFSAGWKNKQKKRFAELHKEASGKKVAVYAPSFSGAPGSPETPGREGIRKVRERLRDEWEIVISPHPLTQSLFPERERNMETEELAAAADLLITDYSSVAYDAMLMDVPVAFYCPDIEIYRKKRGFYLDPECIPGGFAKTPEELIRILESGEWNTPREKLREMTAKYMSSCDGRSAARILERVTGMRSK